MPHHIKFRHHRVEEFVNLTAHDVLAHQFPADCSRKRFARLHVDLHGAGLGFTAKVITYLFLRQMREGTILVEVPSSRRLWCTKPPYTLQCYYQPWTNCSLDDAKDKRIGNISLSDFYGSKVWYGMDHTGDAQRHVRNFLFRPTAKIRHMAHQVASRCGGEGFWTVHIRDSPEKSKERGRLPPASSYFEKIPPHVKSVLWQTSNPKSFGEAVAYAKSHNLRDCYTDFETRHVNDVWAGRSTNTSLIDEAGLVGAVNGALGHDFSAGLISLRSSMWTWFLSAGSRNRQVIVL